MLNVLSKIPRRQVLIIRYLVRNNSTSTVGQLAKSLEVSERTIYEDIKNLKDLMPTNSLQLANNEVIIDLPSYFTVDSMFEMIEELDRVRHLFEIIFKRPTISMEALSKELDLSSSSIYRFIRKINDRFLDRYQITLSVNPFNLEGDERKIRTFFSQFFYESYDKKDWPFNEDFELQFRINEHIQSILSYLDLDIEPDFGMYHHMRIHSYVSIIRTVQGHKVHIDSQVADDFNHFFPSDFLRKIGEDYEKYVAPEEKNMTGDEAGKVLLPQTFYHYLNSNICTSYQDFFNKMSLPFVNESYKKLNKMIDAIYNAHPYSLTNRNQLVLGLHNIICMDLAVQNATHVYDSRKNNFLDRVKQLDPIFFDHVKSHINHYVEEMLGKAEEALTINLLFSFYSHWPDLYLQLLQKQDKVNILFINDLDKKYALETMNFFKHFFDNNCEFNLFDGITYDDFMEVQENYDVILSTFGIESIDDKPVLVIRDFPSKKDLLKLQEIILDLTNLY